MGILSSFFKYKSGKSGIEELINQGALILDVRTKNEFARGHISQSRNIPLDQLNNEILSLDREKPVITCCASGMRSGIAKGILKKNGFKVVENAGSWTKLQKYYP